MKKLIIFDLDGTLLNTLVDLRNSVNYAVKPYNYKEQSLEEIRIHIGNGVAKLVARSIPDAENNPNYRNILSEFKKHYAIHSEDNTSIYDGVRELLFNLKQEKYLLAVCTNKVTEIARPLVEKLFPNTFDFIQGDSPEINNKPSPDMINLTLDNLGVQKDNCMYIGDTDVDEQTAINSGLKYVLVTYGYRTENELKTLCSTAILSDINSLFSKIKEILA